MHSASTLTAEQCARLADAAHACRLAKDSLNVAAEFVPVTGDADLHCLRLDLQRLSRSVAKAIIDADGIRSDATK